MSLESLAAMPGHLLRRAQQLSGAIFAEEIDVADLTSVQYAALVAIKDYPGADATMLSGLIYCDRATIGGVVERLIAKGLVQRRESERDRRVKRLQITAEGVLLLRHVAASVERVQARLLQPFTAAERAMFLKFLAKLVDVQGSPHFVKPCSRPRERARSPA